MDAATRKYLTTCRLWYFPPPPVFARLSAYANKHGDPSGRPYFSADGVKPLSEDEWRLYRAKFRLPLGYTNVWHVNQLRNSERLKDGSRSLHLNQKPISILKMLVEACTDPGDVVWDPFAGLMSVAAACAECGRRCRCAEIRPEVYGAAVERLRSAGASVLETRGRRRP